MSIPQLERYYSWLHKRKSKLQSRLSDYQNIAVDIQSNCNQKSELEKMACIRKSIVRAGLKLEPVTFLSEFSRSVEEYRIVSKEVEDFEKWIKSKGGHLKLL